MVWGKGPPLLLLQVSMLHTTLFASLISVEEIFRVAQRINAAAALAGLATPRAVVQTSGQLAVSGVATGSQGSVDVTGGTGRATLGLALGSVSGLGEDLNVYGSMLCEFPTYPDAPSRIQVSGTATLDVVAAGRSAT